MRHVNTHLPYSTHTTHPLISASTHTHPLTPISLTRFPRPQLCASVQATDCAAGPVELATAWSARSDYRLFNKLKKLPRKAHGELVAGKGDLNITVEKMKCLLDTNWLNSEVITCWLEWWCKEIGAGREQRMPTSSSPQPSCYFASTYFFQKLNGGPDGYCFENVVKWTKSIDVFALDKIIIPVNDANVHWFLAVINFRKKRTERFDSLGQDDPALHAALLRWLDDEHRSKHGSGYDTTGWSQLRDARVPLQDNGSDCGVFTCLFAAYASLDRPFNFTQEHIAIIRRWMVHIIYEIGREETMSAAAAARQRRRRS